MMNPVERLFDVERGHPEFFAPFGGFLDHGSRYV
jgi:hypothetical protein